MKKKKRYVFLNSEEKSTQITWRVLFSLIFPWEFHLDQDRYECNISYGVLGNATTSAMYLLYVSFGPE